MEIIKFWKISNKDGNKYANWQFSNFAQFPVRYDNTIYITNEHFYQSKKAINEEDRYKIIDAPTPHLAAKIGRSIQIRSDWENVKESIMYFGLRLKFDSHEQLKNLLVSTGDAIIIEDSPYDYYWGCGKEGNGRNRLGYLLMKLRDEYNERKVSTVNE